MDILEVYSYIDPSTKLLKKDINQLYIELQLIREQKELVMNKALMVFMCFLMMSAVTFIFGILYMFWKWVLS